MAKLQRSSVCKMKKKTLLLALIVGVMIFHAADVDLASLTKSPSGSSNSSSEVMIVSNKNSESPLVYNGMEESWCRLVPVWGENQTTKEEASVTSPTAENETTPCVGKKPLQPWTTASSLTCSKQKPNHPKSPATTFKKEVQLTIAMMYFAEPTLLRMQLEHLWTNIPPSLQAQIALLVVDDGSPHPVLTANHVLSSSPTTTTRNTTIHADSTTRSTSTNNAMNACAQKQCAHEIPHLQSHTNHHAEALLRQSTVCGLGNA